MSDQTQAPSSRRGRGALLLAAGLGVLVGALFVVALPRSSPPHAHPAESHTEDTVYTCAMHPSVRASEPGACPICGMDLVPVGAGDGADPGDTRVTLSERARKLARLQTTEVSRGEGAEGTLQLLGRIVPNERTRKTITAWTNGRIDSLAVRATGERVKAGQVIATLYSPEIFTAHQDLIVATRQLARMAGANPSARAAAEATLSAARDRLRLLGMNDADLARMERAQSPLRQVPIRSPFSGTVIERIATEGAYVQTGSPLYRIANLSRLWVELDAYEADLSQLSEGQRVELDVQGMSGPPVDGEVEFIDPTLDPIRRTSKVRVALRNDDGSLRPGMFVKASVTTQETGEPGASSPLLVPDTAPLFTGRRSLVYVEVPKAERPTYEARTVRLGPRRGHTYPVVAGLREGERVVTRGAFVLDADLQIRGGDSMMGRPDDLETAALGPAFELSAPSRAALAPVMVAYLSTQSALAQDDLGAAQDAAGVLAQAARSAKLDDAQASALWTPLRQRFVQHAEALQKASGLEAARGSFEALSDAAQRLLTSLGNPLDEEIWLAFCPMALGSDGATWLQRGEEIHNSYFGAQMQDCGELREAVSPGSHMMSSPSATQGAR